MKNRVCDRCGMRSSTYAKEGMPRCTKNELGFHNFVRKGDALYI